MNLSQNLKRIREDSKLTQDELANRSGISKAQISRIETGKQRNPELQTVVALISATGTSLDNLVFGEETEKQIPHLLKAIECLDEKKQEIVTELLKAFVAQSAADEMNKKLSP